ncbi:hypothetical protein [Williamsia sp. D3]|uniref:hypothetical protein n=1 Tax=Williamsia TaxID=85043 RepID=UPI003510896C
MYVAFLVDVFSRRILGWRVMSNKETPLVSSVVEQGCLSSKIRLLVHCNGFGASQRHPESVYVDRFQQGTARGWHHRIYRNGGRCPHGISDWCVQDRVD